MILTEPIQKLLREKDHILNHIESLNNEHKRFINGIALTEASLIEEQKRLDIYRRAIERLDYDSD